MNHLTRRNVLEQTGTTVVALLLPTGKMQGAEGQSGVRREGPDYTSKIPMYTFANTLKEQKAQPKKRIRPYYGLSSRGKGWRTGQDS